MLSRNIISFSKSRLANKTIRNYNTKFQEVWYPTEKSQLDSIDLSYENFISKLGSEYPGYDDAKYMT